MTVRRRLDVAAAAGDTATMDLDLIAEQHVDGAPEAVFALALDPARFPEFFTGYGPIPAVRSVIPHAPPAAGSTREIHNGDGSRLSERITVLDPPRRHAYTLTGLRPPFAWLVRAGHADWRFEPAGTGTRISWHYRWELSSPLAWPVAAPLLRLCMRRAMARCLAAMAAGFSPPHPDPDHTARTER